VIVKKWNGDITSLFTGLNLVVFLPVELRL
jgi:hypothetical protein